MCGWLLPGRCGLWPPSSAKPPDPNTANSRGQPRDSRSRSATHAPASIATTLCASYRVGVRSPLRAGCHWAANSGCRSMRVLPCPTLLPEQQGQPLPWLRFNMLAGHSWPREQSHHTIRPEPANTVSGRNTPLRVGCHSAATAGNSSASVVLPATVPRWNLAIKPSATPSTAKSQIHHQRPHVPADVQHQRTTVYPRIFAHTAAC